MKKLGIGIQSFSELKHGGYIYVDKTRHIYELITTGKYYFLSRPRRFGKSLLVSTLKEIFSGNQQVFQDTWISDKIEWQKYPIIHIDFTQINYQRYSLVEALDSYLKQLAQFLNIAVTAKDSKDLLIEIVRKLSQENKVALLIDEYDKPIIDYLLDFKKANENREILKNFYSGIKSLDEHIKFMFVTGVSKFSKVSIFSDLNNLYDITRTQVFHNIVGYTEEEIKIYYADYLQKLTSESGKKMDVIFEDIRRWYNGYSWTGKERLYNPFSILCLLRDSSFKNYWFATGTPTFLVNIIRDTDVDVEKLSHLAVADVFFDKFELQNLDIYSLLFQTGYLTVKEEKDDAYVLDYPNEEVRVSFLYNLLESFSYQPMSQVSSTFIALRQNIQSDDLGAFIQSLQSLFSSIDYQIFIRNQERYYQSIIYVALSLLGAHINCEVSTNQGRIDAVVKTAKKIYIMEFKMDTAEKALAQIDDKQYYQPYLPENKEIVLVGIGFSSEKRNIDTFVTKTVADFQKK